MVWRPAISTNHWHKSLPLAWRRSRAEQNVMSRGRKATWRKGLGMLKKRHNLCTKDPNAGKNTTSINTSYFIIYCFHEKNMINIWITLTLSHMCLIVWVAFSSWNKFGFTLMYKVLKYLTIITLNICLVHSF